MADIFLQVATSNTVYGLKTVAENDALFYHDTKFPSSKIVASTGSGNLILTKTDMYSIFNNNQTFWVDKEGVRASGYGFLDMSGNNVASVDNDLVFRNLMGETMRILSSGNIIVPGAIDARTLYQNGQGVNDIIASVVTDATNMCRGELAKFVHKTTSNLANLERKLLDDLDHTSYSVHDAIKKTSSSLGLRITQNKFAVSEDMFTLSNCLNQKINEMVSMNSLQLNDIGCAISNEIDKIKYTLDNNIVTQASKLESIANKNDNVLAVCEDQKRMLREQETQNMLLRNYVEEELDTLRNAPKTLISDTDICELKNLVQCGLQQQTVHTNDQIQKTFANTIDFVQSKISHQSNLQQFANIRTEMNMFRSNFTRIQVDINTIEDSTKERFHSVQKEIETSTRHIRELQIFNGKSLDRDKILNIHQSMLSNHEIQIQNCVHGLNQVTRANAEKTIYINDIMKQINETNSDFDMRLRQIKNSMSSSIDNIRHTMQYVTPLQQLPQQIVKETVVVKEIQALGENPLQYDISECCRSNAFVQYFNSPSNMVIEIRDQLYFPPFVINPPLVQSPSDIGLGLWAKHEKGILAFYTGNKVGYPIERARINKKGFLGINTDAPQHFLDVNGSANIKEILEDDKPLSKKYVKTEDIRMYATRKDLEDLERRLISSIACLING
jgi:hypothetical protein